MLAATHRSEKQRAYEHAYYLRARTRPDYHDEKRKAKERWLEKNRDKLAEYNRHYRATHREQIAERRREYQNKKRRTDVFYRLQYLLRLRLRNAIRYGKHGSAVKLLGCTIAELKLHLEKQFLPGMTWSNWGHEGWHIDHIVPLAWFDLRNPEQLKSACHYSNLQPLWAHDNLSKGRNLQ